MKNRPELSKASQIFPEPTKTIQSLPKKASRRLGGGAKPERAKHPKCSAHQNCNDFQSKAYAFNHVSGQSYRWTHAGPSGVENATPSLEMHPTPVPVVENATPSLEMRPKMQPLLQKLARSRPKMQPLRQKWHRRVLGEVGNATPSLGMQPKMQPLRLILARRRPTSIYMCFKGPKTCRDGGNVDLRVNKAHEHFDLTVFHGPEDVPRYVFSKAYISTWGHRFTGKKCTRAFRYICI